MVIQCDIYHSRGMGKGPLRMEVEVLDSVEEYRMSRRGLPLELPKNKEEMVRGARISLLEGRQGETEESTGACRAFGLMIGRAGPCYGRTMRVTECMGKKKEGQSEEVNSPWVKEGQYSLFNFFGWKMRS